MYLLPKVLFFLQLNMVNFMKSAAILLHGPTSAGKSSLAQALQDCAPIPAFHISLDAFVTMSRRRDMRSSEETAEVYHIHCENLRSTLTRLAATRFEIIFDTVLRHEEELHECLRALATRPLYQIHVWAPIEVLEQRERLRDDRANGMAREQVNHPVFRRTYDLSIDTSGMSPVQGAEAIRTLILTSQKSSNSL
jgi:chloramphenicol 3-O phosphotransferase